MFLLGNIFHCRDKHKMKINIQQSLFDALESIERADVPYRNGLGELLPWETMDTLSTFSKPNSALVDIGQKGDIISSVQNRIETTSSGG